MICNTPTGDPCIPECDFFPLDQFARIAKMAGHDLDIEDFMFMGRADRGIHLYKHANTRRYLNLDSSGHAFKFGEGYEPYDNPVDAIEHAFS